MFTLNPLFIGYSNVVLAGNTSGLTSSFTSLLTETSYSSTVPFETCLNPLPNDLGSTDEQLVIFVQFFQLQILY